MAKRSYKAGPLKRPPTHPGEVASGVLEEHRISGRHAASAMGLSPNGLHKVLTGASPVTPETALRFGIYFGNGPELWLNMQREFDLWHARARLAKELARIVPLKDR